MSCWAGAPLALHMEQQIITMVLIKIHFGLEKDIIVYVGAQALMVSSFMPMVQMY